MAQPAKGLGCGLSALMGDSAMPVAVPVVAPTMTTVTGGQVNALTGDTIRSLPVSALIAGKYQPRHHFDEEALVELSVSIERHGVMQPIVVRESGGKYEIIAGERRFRAAKLAKLTEVPVIVREVKDRDALELALIENIQREDLNPLDEAAGYQRLMDEFGYTQEKLAPRVGKSRSHIANLLRLLTLPDKIKASLNSGTLTVGHARALLMADDPEDMMKEIKGMGLSVRETEALVRRQADLKAASPAKAKTAAGKVAPAPRSQAGKNEDIVQLESMLTNNLGLPVSINLRSGQAGEVVINYDSLRQLDEILRRLGNGA